MDAVQNEDFDIQLCYLLVLAETKTAQILTAFLNKGGWPTLARWLNGYIEQKHFVGIRQLVKTYRSLPVTHSLLKKPIESGKMPGKMIRSLRKHDDEVIKGNGSLRAPEPYHPFSTVENDCFSTAFDTLTSMLPNTRILADPGQTESCWTMESSISFFHSFLDCRAKQSC